MEKKRQFKKHVKIAVTAIKEIMDIQHAYRDTTIEMAKQYGVSRNVLQSAFKQEYGVSIRDYKLQQRMEISKEMLEQGKDVKQVYIELQYATQSGFTAAYRKFHGTTPSRSTIGRSYFFASNGAK